ncbi:MAG: allophanate hydrolase [Fibrobacteria bacterium]
MSATKAGSMEIRKLKSWFGEDYSRLSSFLDDLRRRIDDHPDPAIWISRVPWDQVLERAERLSQAGKSGDVDLRYPLFGIPFAVKDNIDVQGLDTTAACPAFAYRPHASASAVARLEAAGAILIGKTNMDQFATGLVGTRSPYGTVGNPFHPSFISGGSSSGSAAAVAAGLVSFALGTDTAGSGRIPAGFNNLVGLKPTRGLISAHGVFPACRSLDCVSVFALTCEDAFQVMQHCRGEDPLDAFSRRVPVDCLRESYAFLPADTGRFRFGVPDPAHLEFFGDRESAVLFKEAQDRLTALGGIGVEIPFAPFAEAARLLYQGPWLAERQASFGDFLDQRPGEVLPVIREVMARAKTLTATDGFLSYYRLRELRAQAESLFRGMDVMLVPTAPTHYTRDEVEAEPVELNTRLGLYTNFVNLMDLCALAVPSGRKANGLPFGVTLIAPAFHEGRLSSLGARFHAASGLTLGTTAQTAQLPVSHSAMAPSTATAVKLAVAGLHLSGQPLNSQLTDLGARLVTTCKTAPVYRAFALERPGRVFPGLVRVGEGGGAMELEVWEISGSALGAFMENVKEPLCIGTVELETGEKIKGFLCEQAGVGSAREITELGGWRAYLAESKPPA